MTDAPPPRGAGEDRLRILCLGGTAVDHVFGVDAIPARPIKVQAISYLERCDGVAAMAACAIAARGHAVRFWGRFGADANGRRLAERLARAGIELDAAGSRTAGRTATAAAIVDAAGRRLVARFRGAGLDDDPGWLPLNEVARADAVLVDAGWMAGAQTLLRAARDGRVPSVLVAGKGDPGPVADLSALADHTLAPAGDPGGRFHGAFVIAIARGATGAEALAIATAAAADRPAPGTKFSPA